MLISFSLAAEKSDERGENWKVQFNCENLNTIMCGCKRVYNLISKIHYIKSTKSDYCDWKNVVYYECAYKLKHRTEKVTMLGSQCFAIYCQVLLVARRSISRRRATLCECLLLAHTIQNSNLPSRLLFSLKYILNTTATLEWSSM